MNFVCCDWNRNCYYIILHDIKRDSWVLFVMLLTLEQKWCMLHLLHGFQNLMVIVKAAFMSRNPAIMSVTCLPVHLSRIWYSVLLRVMLHIHKINYLDVGKSSECCSKDLGFKITYINLTHWAWYRVSSIHCTCL